MFEKEATEYAIIGWDKSSDPRDVFVPRIDETKFNDWRNGAEFGYNRANEWHYVKDGISPTHSYRVLVFTDEGVGFGIYGLDDKKWHTYDTGFEVIAWKEIVLPKLKESE